MENKLNTLPAEKDIFENIKGDSKSLLFSEENLIMIYLKKLKRTACSKDKLLLKLIDSIENDMILGKKIRAKKIKYQ